MSPPPDFRRYGDRALLGLLSAILTVARERRLDAELTALLGDTLHEMRLEATSRQAKAGLPSLFTALPSVVAAERK